MNTPLYRITQDEYIKWYMQLLEMETEALRSVLSEFEGDKREYVQMIKADAIQELKHSLRRP